MKTNAKKCDLFKDKTLETIICVYAVAMKLVDSFTKKFKIHSNTKIFLIQHVKNF